MIIASAVIRTGRKRVKPASSAAAAASRPSASCSLAKLTTRMLFAVATPMHMIAPVRAGTLSGRVDEEEHPGDAGDRRGQRRNDDQRIEPRLEVHDDEEVDENDREESPASSPRNESRIVRICPRDDQVRTARQLLLRPVDDLLDGSGHGAEVASRRRPRRRRRRAGR